MPPWYAESRYASAQPSHGMIALSEGGFMPATFHCDVAWYEMPAVPTLPLHHGCFADHSIES